MLGQFWHKNNELFALAFGLLCIETIIIVFHFPNKEKLSKELATERGEGRGGLRECEIGQIQINHF